MTAPVQPEGATRPASAPRTPAANQPEPSLIQAGANSTTRKARTPQTFNVYRYPQEVGTNEYPAYIMFYVTSRSADFGSANVAKDSRGRSISVDVSRQNRVDTSKITGLGAVSFYTAYKLGANFGEDVAKESIQASTAVAKGAIGVAKATTRFVAKAAGDFIGTSIEDLERQGINIAGKIAGVAFATAVGVSLPEGSQERVVLKDAIALHLSDPPSANYRAGWAETDLGAYPKLGGALQGLATPFQNMSGGGAMDVVSAGYESVKALESVFSSAGQVLASVALRNAAKLTPTFGEIGNVEGSFSASTRTVINPFKAQLFKSMGFRTFGYSYKFLPKNSVEYENVQNIIKTFKKYMHPNNGTLDLYIGFPAEFVIAYYYRDKENLNVAKISNCALTGLNVTYGDQDFTVFKDSNNGQGKPTEINISLTFTELELLTQDRIEDGY